MIKNAGCKQMARLFRTDGEAFDKQTESGRAFFHEPREDKSTAPAWLWELVNAVCGHLSADTAMARMDLIRKGAKQNVER